jgi:hypothetical protein
MLPYLLILGACLLFGSVVWGLVRGARAYLEAADRSSFPEAPVVSDPRAPLVAATRLGTAPARLHVRPVAPARKGITR